MPHTGSLGITSPFTLHNHEHIQVSCLPFVINGSLRLYLILLDLFFFGIGGAAAEWCLTQRGFMYYANGWTSIHAFIAYFAVWLILHILLDALMRRKRNT